MLCFGEMKERERGKRRKISVDFFLTITLLYCMCAMTL